MQKMLIMAETVCGVGSGVWRILWFVVYVLVNLKPL